MADPNYRLEPNTIVVQLDAIGDVVSVESGRSRDYEIRALLDTVQWLFTEYHECREENAG